MEWFFEQGTIPKCLASISSLQLLALNDNDLHGSLPPEFGRLTKLATLSVANNRLEVPLSFVHWEEALFEASEYCIFWFKSQGKIPEEYKTMAALQVQS